MCDGCSGGVFFGAGGVGEGGESVRRAGEVWREEGNPRGVESGGGGCLFGVEVCDGEAVVDSVGGFGEDCGEKAYWNSEGGVGPR